MRLQNNKGFMWNKNQMMNWNILSYEGSVPFEPAFKIGITDVEWN
jgi:hypothetical protein